MSPNSFNENVTKTLTDLGLSLRQTKVYLTLVKFGILTIKEISTNSKVPRQDVYRIVSELQERGLIEKHITIPTSFHAIDLDSAVKILLETRREKSYEIEEAAKKILDKHQKMGYSFLESRAPSRFVLIPAGKIFAQRVNEAIERTKTKIDFLFFQEAFPTAYSYHGEIWSKILKEGIQIRWIVASKTEDLPKISVKNPCGEFRFIVKSNVAPIGLYDEREAIIATTTNVPLDPCLWTDNRPLIAILQNYFDILWDKAVPK